MLAQAGLRPLEFHKSLGKACTLLWDRNGLIMISFLEGQHYKLGELLRATNSSEKNIKSKRSDFEVERCNSSSKRYKIPHRSMNSSQN